jgi:quinol-cytochrome oxidoreductase complex cytochrome b subunit
LLAALKDLIRAGERKTVPAGPLAYLGSLVFIVISLEAVTGILLMVYYRPSAAAAYYSTEILTDEVLLGWLIRSLHRWGFDLLVIISVLHMISVYFSRGYQTPHQITWALGVCLLVFITALGFTGTLLPWDQYGYWYTDSARQTIANIPLGNVLLALFWGGWEIGEEVLLRFYAVHVSVMPSFVLVLLIAHVSMVWRFGIKTPAETPAKPRPQPTPLFPDFLLNLLILVLLTSGLLLSLAVFFPASLTEHADPLSPLVDPQPRWYFLPIHGLLRNLHGAAASLSIITLLVVLFLVPVLDAKPAQTAWRKLTQRTLGCLVIAGWVLLGIRAYLQ